MNDVQRKLLEEKIRKICKDCDTIFDEKLNQIPDFVVKKDVEIYYNCTYFTPASISQILGVDGECCFGCTRPQTPNGYCKAFKKWYKSTTP